MNDILTQLTAAALSGVAARPRGGHGAPVRPAAEIAAEAVELARATYEALEQNQPAKTPAPLPKGQR